MAELVAIAYAQPKRMVLVYDQSLARGRELRDLKGKLAALGAHGLHGSAYVSQACFVLLGEDSVMGKRAFATPRKESRLPASRFLRAEPPID